MMGISISILIFFRQMIIMANPTCSWQISSAKPAEKHDIHIIIIVPVGWFRPDIDRGGFHCGNHQKWRLWWKIHGWELEAPPSWETSIVFLYGLTSSSSRVSAKPRIIASLTRNDHGNFQCSFELPQSLDWFTGKLIPETPMILIVTSMGSG